LYALNDVTIGFSHMLTYRCTKGYSGRPHERGITSTQT